MANTYNFGAAGTLRSSNTGATTIYQDSLGIPTGNTNIFGSVVVNYGTPTVNGLSGGDASYSSSGGGTCTVTRTASYPPGIAFSRYTGNGLTITETGPGASPWTDSSLQGSVPWTTVPTAPATISTSKSGTSVTVTCTASPSNGGNTILAYYAAYSENGAAYVGGSVMSSLSYTFTGLNPGSSYTFRVFSGNADGYSAARVSSAVNIYAPVKLYNTNTASAWAFATTSQRFNGTAWVPITIAKRYNGTTWVDITT